MNRPVTKLTALLEENKLLLTSAFKSCGVEQNLQNLILNSASQLLKATDAPLKKLIYMAHLQNDLLILCKNTKLTRINLTLEEYLYEMNFNTSDHIAYCKMKIVKDTADLYDDSEKYLVLCEYKRRFSAMLANKNICFDKKLESVQDMMLSFLSAELKCCKKLLFGKDGRNREIVENEVGVNAQVSVLVSVDVLAYLFFLLVKNGVFPEEAKTPLMRIIAYYFKTPGVGPEGVSLNSLRVKFRQAVQTTAIKVRALLVRMVKQIDEDFGLN